MELPCVIEGCSEPSMHHRRVCRQHYNASHAEAQRKVRRDSPNSNYDFMSPIRDAENIPLQVAANNESNRVMNRGLSALGYVNTNNEPSFVSKVTQIAQDYALSLLTSLTGRSLRQLPLPASPIVHSPSFLSASMSEQSTPDSFTSVYSPQSSQTSAPSSPPSDETRPLTDIEELYKGCDGDFNLSIAILGSPRSGKSYAARYLIEELHKRNNYKHFLMITNEGSYINRKNVIANISHVHQTI